MSAKPEEIQKLIKNSIAVKELVCDTQIDEIAKAADIIVKTLLSGGKLLVCGNGGSAADSQHIVAELVGRFRKERRPLAAVALTTNTSSLTAIANDYGYDVSFERQVEAIGKAKDALLGISTSGNSKNVILAIKKAQALGVSTITLTGCNGGQMAELSDVAIIVQSKDTPRVQESHLMIGHILCELIENEICGS